MFDRELLRSLRAVVDLGTVTAAAQQLRLTPSAVSQQLQRLHRQTGVELFERRGRLVHPTQAARVLADAATEMDVADARARARLEELEETPSGEVIVGGFPSACRGLLAPVVAAIARDYPRVTLVVHEAYPEEGVGKTIKGEVDIAVVHEWTDVPLAVPASLTTHVLGTDDVDLIVPCDHPAAQWESVQVADLPHERWITDTTQIYARWLQHSLDTAKIPYELAGLVNEHETQIRLSANGLGLSIAPKLGRTRLPDNVRAVAIKGEAPLRRIFRVERKDSIDRPALAVVRHALDEQASAVLEELQHT